MSISLTLLCAVLFYITYFCTSVYIFFFYCSICKPKKYASSLFLKAICFENVCECSKLSTFTAILYSAIKTNLNTH